MANGAGGSVTPVNPYAPGEVHRRAAPRTPASPLFWILAAGFGAYVVLGQWVLYGRMARAHALLGMEGVRPFFASSLLLVFLSCFGLACVVATFVYTFRRNQIRPVIVALLAGTGLLLLACAVGYFTLEDNWLAAFQTVLE